MQKLEQIAGLTCRVVQELDPGETPKLVVILCHGFGAPGTDLVPIGPEILEVSPRLRDAVQFIFPEGPLSLDAYGMTACRAWWPLDVARLMAAVESGQFQQLRNSQPRGLPAARDLLTGLVNEVQGRTGLPLSRIVLGGFSQGSMLATDVALRLSEPPGALIVWSGTLLCEDEWRELANRRGSLRVLQSHGRHDQILPFEAALWLRDLFQEAGFDGEFIDFPGPHTIPVIALEATVGLLQSLLPG